MENKQMGSKIRARGWRERKEPCVGLKLVQEMYRVTAKEAVRDQQCVMASEYEACVVVADRAGGCTSVLYTVLIM
jgi:hypothetical protein